VRLRCTRLAALLAAEVRLAYGSRIGRSANLRPSARQDRSRTDSQAYVLRDPHWVGQERKI
jgi:hypothetical protein